MRVQDDERVEGIDAGIIIFFLFSKWTKYRLFLVIMIFFFVSLLYACIHIVAITTQG